MPKTKKYYKNKEKLKAYLNRNNKANYDKGGFVKTDKHERIRYWTQEEVDTLKHLKEKGYRDREVAQVLERSVKSIQIKRSYMKRNRRMP